MNIKHLFKVIGRACCIIWDELLVSFLLVFAITFVLALIFYHVEKSAQPEVYDNFFRAFAWSTTRYIESGDGAFDGPPVTVLGRWIAGILGFVGLALVVIPTGLLGTGYSKAMEEEKRNKELEGYYHTIMRMFSVSVGREVRRYLDRLPKDKEAWYAGCGFSHVSRCVSFAKLQIKGLELKDVVDVCKLHPELRVKNQAQAQGSDDLKQDRFLVECFPVNRSYGYCVDRGSKVTIVSTSSHKELGTGHFAYYLAKFAGFNYISKDFSAADGESFFNNHWGEPKYDQLTLEERKARGEKVDRKLREKYENKKALRDAFLNDLEGLCREEGSWVICVLNHIKNKKNVADIHVASSLADGSCSTILTDRDTYDKLVFSLWKNLDKDLGLSLEETRRYPHVKRGSYRNLIYKLQEDGCRCNGLVLRVSSELLTHDVNTTLADFVIAKTIHDVIEPEHRLLPEEVADMNRTSSNKGFDDQKIDEWKGKLYASE